MYLFQAGLDPTPAFAGQDFEAFLTSPGPEADGGAVNGFLNPNDLSIKREHDQVSPVSENVRFGRSPRGSGSSGSSSDYSTYDKRNISKTSTTSLPLPHNAAQAAWGSGINGFSMPSNENLFEDSGMTGIDQDFEASNQQMASDFDFDTAASTPSGFDGAGAAKSTGADHALPPTNNVMRFGPVKAPSTGFPAPGQPQFFFPGSREASPLNPMLISAPSQSPWNKHSPSSGLEETFNHITMNGDSPGHPTFSPGLNFSVNGFSFDPESSTTPSTLAKDVSSPPSTVNSADGTPVLTVYPTSLKSRVETQIPIKMTLSPAPVGAKKLRLPKHTVSKPKFLAKPDVERSAEILELHTSLVCTSAVQDPAKLQRAWARARGEDVGPYTRPSPASSHGSPSSREDDDKPLNGGEVRICSGCIQRERKRASRKKQKKPEEEELFQKDEEKRVVVFNTNEIKDWVEVPRDPPTGSATIEGQAPATGAIQVELPMRIACYCRHQNEKMGFQVIFTIKDHRDRVIAQAMTNPIMITDDHKTHNPPALVQNSPAPPQTTAPQVPGAGVFSTSGAETRPVNPKMFKQSFSTTDLHGLRHNFNHPPFPIAPPSNPFAIPMAVSSHPSTTLTPRNLSRPVSPSGPAGPTTKRRKQSGSGKLPSGLTMTRLDTSQATPGPSSMVPTTTASSPYAPNMASYMAPSDRPFALPSARPAPFGTSPPTPNGKEPSFPPGINRSFSLENLPRQAMMSAPPSRQPSRPGSPGSTRNSFGAADAAFGQAVSNQLMGQPTRRPAPLIHKLVPAEGSVTGGTEVTLLGNGFYQGLEVMFGDTEATTTTFWGEKCLNCIAPPALQPGIVQVVFKHEHPQYATVPPQSQSRPSMFTYIDDREIEMFRLALRTIGKQMQHPTDDPYSAAQQLLQGQSHSLWPPPHGNYGMGAGHQRHAATSGSSPLDTLELEAMMVRVLQFMDDQTPLKPLLDLRRPSGLTLLHLASSLGLTHFVAGLLSRGANPNAMDNNGHTPMHHAAMNGHIHIIHRLRLSGANHQIRSIRNFTPADVAASLLAYQATTSPIHHYRSRSEGETPMRLHSRSSSSLRSFWENASNHYAASDTDDSDDETDHLHMVATSSEEMEPDRPFGPLNIKGALSGPESRRSSVQHHPGPYSQENPSNDAPPPLARTAFMLAWRDHLVAQLHQFNDSAQSVMPNLVTLNTPLSALQDYQANPMVRRVSSLFPQRPSSRQQGTASSPREGWWETLTGGGSPTPPAPPAYGDLYPEDTSPKDDFSLKKSSAIQAAADAAADLHFEAQGGRHRPGQSSQAVSPGPAKLATVNGRTIERVELSRDRKLFFFWV